MAIENNRRCLFGDGSQLTEAAVEPCVKQLLKRSLVELYLAKLRQLDSPFFRQFKFLLQQRDFIGSHLNTQITRGQ